MQNFNNYGNYRNANGIPNNVPRNNVGNNAAWNSGAYNGMGYQADNYSVGQIGYQANNYSQPQSQIDDRVFVAGRIGADAFQLQPGVNVQVLWDDDEDRFYLKGYDDKGRPRVLGDFDFHPHVETNPSQNGGNVDLSMYATKDDIKNMISEALKKNKNNTNNYVTVDEFNKTLSELCVGNGGKVVRANESDA